MKIKLFAIIVVSSSFCMAGATEESLQQRRETWLREAQRRAQESQLREAEERRQIEEIGETYHARDQRQKWDQEWERKEQLSKAAGEESRKALQEKKRKSLEPPSSFAVWSNRVFMACMFIGVILGGLVGGGRGLIGCVLGIFVTIGFLVITFIIISIMDM